MGETHKKSIMPIKVLFTLLYNCQLSQQNSTWIVNRYIIGHNIHIYVQTDTVEGKRPHITGLHVDDVDAHGGEVAEDHEHHQQPPHQVGTRGHTLRPFLDLGRKGTWILEYVVWCPALICVLSRDCERYQQGTNWPVTQRKILDREKIIFLSSAVKAFKLSCVNIIQVREGYCQHFACLLVWIIWSASFSLAFFLHREQNSTFFEINILKSSI